MAPMHLKIKVCTGDLVSIFESFFLNWILYTNIPLLTVLVLDQARNRSLTDEQLSIELVHVRRLVFSARYSITSRFSHTIPYNSSYKSLQETVGGVSSEGSYLTWFPACFSISKDSDNSKEPPAAFLS